jgi:hypothetical protein
MPRRVLDVILGLIGAAVGGALGYAAYVWILGQGFYAVILPGAFVGLGGGLLSRERSALRGAFLGLAALALGLFADWKFFPFAADESFTFFLTHILDKAPVKLLMIALGTFFGFWWGRDAIPGVLNRRPDLLRESSASGRK